MKKLGAFLFPFSLVLFVLVGLNSFSSARQASLSKKITLSCAVSQSNFSSSNAEETHMVIRNRHAVENEDVTVANPNVVAIHITTDCPHDAGYFSRWHSYFFVVDENLPKQRVLPPLFGLRAPPYSV